MAQPPSDHELILSLFRTLDLAMLTEAAPSQDSAEDSTFRAVGPAPAWMSFVFPGDLEQLKPVDACAFLQNFIVDAQTFWTIDRPGKLRSGFWVIQDDADQEHVFEASALRIDDTPILLIERAPNAYEDMHKVIQVGREISNR